MVGIIPKPPVKTLWWQDILLYFSIALLAAVVLGYFILGNFQNKSSVSLQNLEETLATEKTPQERSAEKEVFQYRKKISDFSNLLNDHKKTSKFFEVLEVNSHPKIWFLKFILNPDDLQVLLSGQAESFQVLGEQLILFREVKELSKVDLSETAIGKNGKIEFTFLLSLDSKIFK
ncbi:MAG TPA: hypothetical protein QGH92_00315 [Candidatus Parcubacteria bacterium]|jgi:hypothetical protein|nr:hypothetical protein [Candidatus Parcubacteria bacterium]|tara:strand:+ start:286 stop:810 length:525 start_codon:yes stop_codon:yes gene_type:complete